MPQQQRQAPPSPNQSTQSQSRSSQNTRRQNPGGYPALNHAHSRVNLRPPDGQHSRSFSEGNVPNSSAGGPRSPQGQRTYGPEDPEVATCDACMGPIHSSDHRVQCTVCYDYDLCLSCFRAGKTSKGHEIGHVISHVSNTEVVEHEDLVPVKDEVNPATNPIDGKTNWSIVDHQPGTPQNPKKHTISTRVLHLYDKDSHARFLSFCKPGHYGVLITIAVTFSKKLDQTGRQALQQRLEKAGQLLVTFGRVKSKWEFCNGVYSEDTIADGKLAPTSIPKRLLDPLWGAKQKIDLEDRIQLQTTCILHLEGEPDELIPVGLILQWSRVSYFSDCSDPVVSLTVDSIRSVEPLAPLRL
jgi:hypothetical protein